MLLCQVIESVAGTGGCARRSYALITNSLIGVEVQCAINARLKPSAFGNLAITHFGTVFIQRQLM